MDTKNGNLSDESNHPAHINYNGASNISTINKEENEIEKLRYPQPPALDNEEDNKSTEEENKFNQEEEEDHKLDPTHKELGKIDKINPEGEEDNKLDPTHKEAKELGKIDPEGEEDNKLDPTHKEAKELGKIDKINPEGEEDNKLDPTHKEAKELGKIVQMSFGVFIVYLGCYFLPYMAMAFWNDPIQTAVVYTILGIIAIFCYCVIYGFIPCIPICPYISTQKCLGMFSCFPNCLSKNCIDKCINFTFVIAAVSSIGLLIAILIFFIRMGSFHDPQAVDRLALPLLISVLTICILQPFFNYIKGHVKKDNHAM